MMTSAARATFDDANLILRLYDMRREERMREARRWFAASFRARTLEEFGAVCPPGSDPNASYRMVVSYWEMVASFMTGGVLSKELFFQSGRELLFVWERVRDLLPLVREANQNPIELRSLETVAREYIAWLDKQAPGSYEAFGRRVRG